MEMLSTPTASRLTPGVFLDPLRQDDSDHLADETLTGTSSTPLANTVTRGSSIQSRRRASGSLGLGVSFAVPALNGNTNGSSGGSATSSQDPTGRPRTASTSRSHSRRGSLAASVEGLTSSFSSSPSSDPPRSSATSTSRPSRRPSLSHLASFLSGIEHHTRVRTVGGRGVSRSASRSTSRVGLDRSEDGSRSRASSFAGSLRRGDVEEEDEYGTPTAAGFFYPPQQQTQRHVFQASKVLPTHSGEEPYLETAPSSPVPKHLNYYPTSSFYPPYAPPAPAAPDPTSSLENVDVFDEGDRIGVGVWLEDRGGWVRDCFAQGGISEGEDHADRVVVGAPTEMEVVSRLGEGTYAIVYLVREVLYDPPDEDALSPLEASFGFSSVSSISSLTYPFPLITPTTPSPPVHRPPYTSWASDPFLPRAAPVYGRSFALKCLCKKDLSPELVEVQRGEAVLHRALPEHEYIVRLYGAYETDDWLFLVLEYCPGQDLFYWLDERQDSSLSLYGSRTTSPQPTSTASVPATPSAVRGSIEMDRHSIASTDAEGDEEESLFSRTITQSTGAALMDAAHQQQKQQQQSARPPLHLSTGPEALADSSDLTPPSPSLLSSTVNDMLLSRKRLRLISRMFGQMCAAVQACHAVGVAHRDIKPENFIVMDGRGEGNRVVVKITDWGLGTREAVCEDFDCGSKPYMAYECRNNLQPTYDPRQADVWSLGLVLLNLLFHRNPWADPSLDDPDFADYVRDPLGFLQDRFEGIGLEVATFLTHRVFCDVLEREEDGQMRKRVTAAEFGKWASRLVMMMGEGQRKRASVSEHTLPLVSGGSRMGLVSSQTNSLLSSPEPTLLHEGAVDKLAEIAEEKLPTASTALHQHDSTPAFNLDDDDDQSALPSPTFPPSGVPSPSTSLLSEMLRHSGSTSPALLDPPVSVSPLRNSLVIPMGALHLDTPESAIADASRSTPPEDSSIPATTAEEAFKAKRRKRGARKGKGSRPTGSEPSPPLEAGVSRDQVLADLAAASQDLARELSKSTSPRSATFGTQSASAVGARSSSGSLNRLANGDVPKKPKFGGGVFERMRNNFANGNPDLEAFRQRAEEKNASFGKSAPAQMQHGRGQSTSTDTGFSSRGSVGNTSWGSYAPTELEERVTIDGVVQSAHFSSASSRRDRLDKQRRPGATSTTRNGTTTTASAHGSPIIYAEQSSSKDWRQPSPLTRPHAPAVAVPTLSLLDERLNPASAPSVPYAHPLRVDLPNRTASPPQSTPSRLSSPAITKSIATPHAVTKTSHLSTPSAPILHASPPTKPNKLAKLLQGITVFNNRKSGE